MLSRFVFIAALLWTSVAAAGNQSQSLSEKSAYRHPSISYQVYMNRARTMSARPIEQQGKSALDSAVRFQGAQLPAAQAWSDEQEMLSNFKRLRDERFLVDQTHQGFMRRSTWLYPDDGCFARAQLANNNLLKWNVASPSKVFAFGDLQVLTENSPDGQVTWWYHVAPLVEIEGKKFVLDPALDPRRPLPLADWLKLQNSNPGQLEVAVCNSGSYSPYDACNRQIELDESEAERDQQSYLGAEWMRLERLGRDPRQELGENPPWL